MPDSMHPNSALPNSALPNSAPPNSTHWLPQLTQDGSFTFFSEEFGEAFHSQQGAKTEAFQKFAEATQLAEKAIAGRSQPPDRSSHSLRLLDVCYGLGYNTAAAIETIWAANPDCSVEVYGLELDATVPQAAIAPPLIESWSASVQEILRSLALQQAYQSDRLAAKLLIGDARQTVLQVIQWGFQADAILFDPFSPRCCPQLWTVEFFQTVSQCLAPTGRLATYSRSASVRSALLQAGLAIGSIPMIGTHSSQEWSQGTIASFDKTALPALPALSPMEQEHLRTRAAIPYRDPNLSDSAIDILARHQKEQSNSLLESTSSWRRRWNIR